jgi:hypothetical protein
MVRERDAVTEIVHIAAQPVVIGSHHRQRCAWCGAVIDDIYLGRLAPEIADADFTIPTWPIGELIGVDGAATYVIDHEDGADVPPTSCAALDPEITR